MDHAANPTQALAEFAAGLRFDAIPAPVVRRLDDLFLDWFASALAGKGRAAGMRAVMAQTWALARAPKVGSFLACRP